jgi:hypothetical protein
MSRLDQTTFQTTYAGISGTFEDNTTRQITEGDLRQFARDISDSVAFGTGVFSQSYIISSVQINNSFTAPVELLAAPGANVTLLPVSFYAFMDYGGTIFATNTTFRFEINGVAVSTTNTSLLPSAADRRLILPASSADTSSDLSNKALVFKAQGGNPTAGNGTLYITVAYALGYETA